MPTKFAKGGKVHVHAEYWCYGKISFVFKKKARMSQKYRIKYHEGTVMESLEAGIEWRHKMRS